MPLNRFRLPGRVTARIYTLTAALASLATAGCLTVLQPPLACQIGPPELFGAGVLSTPTAEEWAFAFDPGGTTLLLQRGDFKKY
ncbi:MAG: hypothetical protein ACLGI6_05575, partial [Gammaproteobacteria bacterium]